MNDVAVRKMPPRNGSLVDANGIEKDQCTYRRLNLHDNPSKLTNQFASFGGTLKDEMRLANL